MDDAQADFCREHGLDTKLYSVGGGSIPLIVSGVEGIVGVMSVVGVRQNQGYKLAIEVLRAVVKEGGGVSNFVGE